VDGRAACTKAKSAILDCLVIHADSSRGGRVFTSVCLFVCEFVSVFLHNVSKTDAVRITKLDIEIFHDEFGKPVYFGIKRSKVTSHKDIAGVGIYTLASACFF